MTLVQQTDNHSTYVHYANDSLALDSVVELEPAPLV